MDFDIKADSKPEKQWDTSLKRDTGTWQFKITSGTW